MRERRSRPLWNPCLATTPSVTQGTDRQHPSITFAVLALGGVSYALLQSLVAPARTVGGAFGGAATASIIAGTVGANRYPTAHGYTLAFGICAFALAVGVVAGLFIPSRRVEETFEPHAAGDVAESAA